jgi:hypothetical protein
VLQIKNEVYMNNYCKSSDSRSMVYHSLRSNMEILRKKHPLMFVNYVYTQSCSDSSYSKKSSFNYGHSLVLDRVELDRNRQEDKQCLQEKGNETANIALA